MNAAAILAAARERGVELTVADGRLRYRGPAGALDADLRRAAARHREELLALLAGSPEHDAEDAGALLADLQARGFTVTRARSKVLVSPGGLLTEADRNVIGRHKTALLEVIDVLATVKELFPPGPEYDDPRRVAEMWSATERIRAEWEALQARPSDEHEADAELRAALAVIDTAEAAAWPSAAQRTVLAVFRQQVADYRALQDPQLFGASAWVQRYVVRWRVEHEAAIRKGRK
jgi:hypothetical protein